MESGAQVESLVLDYKMEMQSIATNGKTDYKCIDAGN